MEGWNAQAERKQAGVRGGEGVTFTTTTTPANMTHVNNIVQKKKKKKKNSPSTYPSSDKLTP